MEALALHRNQIPASKKHKNANTTKFTIIHMKEYSPRFVVTGII